MNEPTFESKGGFEIANDQTALLCSRGAHFSNREASDRIDLRVTSMPYRAHVCRYCRCIYVNYNG